MYDSFIRHLLTLSATALILLPGTAAAADSHASGPGVAPAVALERLREGNHRFVAGHPAARDLRHQREETEEAQHPYAAVLSCIDSRASSEIIFDQGIGDIFNARVAGNIVDDDVLASLEYATGVAGAQLVVVVGHTNCGAVKGAVDDVHLGHVTSLVAKIKPWVDEVAHGEAHTSQNHALVDRAAEANVHHVTSELLDKSPLMQQLVARKKLEVVGAMYDLHTGKVTFYTGNVKDSPK
jgi:carbonic anhydrase